eukprot:1149671-Pelagomonas_calceolata.AAC.12
MPVTKARVYLKSRNTSIGSLPPPPVHSASLRIQQKLGLRIHKTLPVSIGIKRASGDLEGC